MKKKWLLFFVILFTGNSGCIQKNPKKNSASPTIQQQSENFFLNRDLPAVSLKTLANFVGKDHVVLVLEFEANDIDYIEYTVCPDSDPACSKDDSKKRTLSQGIKNDSFGNPPLGPITVFFRACQNAGRLRSEDGRCTDLASAKHEIQGGRNPNLGSALEAIEILVEQKGMLCHDLFTILDNVFNPKAKKPLTLEELKDDQGKKILDELKNIYTLGEENCRNKWQSIYGELEDVELGRCVKKHADSLPPTASLAGDPNNLQALATTTGTIAAALLVLGASQVAYAMPNNKMSALWYSAKVGGAWVLLPVAVGGSLAVLFSGSEVNPSFFETYMRIKAVDAVVDLGTTAASNISTDPNRKTEAAINEKRRATFERGTNMLRIGGLFGAASIISAIVFATQKKTQLAAGNSSAEKFLNLFRTFIEAKEIDVKITKLKKALPPL